MNWFKEISGVLLLLCFCSSIYATTRPDIQIKTYPDQRTLPLEIDFYPQIQGMIPALYSWHFGDGGTSSKKNVKHTYNSSGEYTVWLNVMDDTGNVWHSTKKISILSNAFDIRNTNIQTHTYTDHITSIIMDQQHSNVLWVGTTGGLVRFDLYTGERKIFTNELPSLYITSLLISKDRYLWISTYGGLTCFDTDNNQWHSYTSSNSSLPSNSILHIIQSQDSAIWIATKFGLARLDYFNNEWKIYDSNEMGLSGECYALCQTSDGTIWVGLNSGLFKLNYFTDQWKRYSASENAIPYTKILSVSETSSTDDIWLGTESGLIQFDHKNNLRKNIFYQNQSICHTFSWNDNIWAIVQNNEVAGVNSNTLSNTVYPVDSTTDLFIETMLPDSDGNILAGTSNGQILFFDVQLKKWSSLKYPKSGLKNQTITALAKDTNYCIWIGTQGGKLVHLDDFRNLWTTYDASNSILSDNDDIYSIFQSSANKLWIGTNGNGIIYFDLDQHWMRYNTIDGAIRSILQDTDGNLWIGTDEGIYKMRQVNQKWQLSDKIELDGISVYSLINASNEWVYAGTSSGLGMFDSKWRRIDLSQQLRSPALYSIVYTSDHSVLFSSDYEFGFYPSNPLAVFSPQDETLNSFRSVLQTPDKAIWLGTDHSGVVRVDTSTDTWTVLNSNQTNIPNNSIRAMIQSSDHTIWAGTNNGLSKITFQMSQATQGRLILIAGGGASTNNRLWPTTRELSILVYRTFSVRGYKNSDIYYLCPEKWIDFNGDGFDDHIVDIPKDDENRNPTIEDIRYAITEWAVENYSQNTPLYIYLIGHGYPETDEYDPGFVVAPGQILYAGTLHEMLNTYENATNGNTIIINESCYSGDFMYPLKKRGRIIITSTSDNTVNYSNYGFNSFTQFFMKQLFENDSLHQAFSVAVNELKKSTITSGQKPLLDDNFDGESNSTDGLISSNIFLGDNFFMGAPWPDIMAVSHQQISASTISFTVTTNSHMKKVWATIQPPNYVPEEANNDYPDIQLNVFDFFKTYQEFTYYAEYDQFTEDNGYVVTIYAMDQFGNVAMYSVETGHKGQGLITGTIISASSAELSTISIMIMESNDSIAVKEDGSFEIAVPMGCYTLVVNGPMIETFTIPDVHVLTEQITNISSFHVQKNIHVNCVPGDTNYDGTVKIDDLINVLWMMCDKVIPDEGKKQ